MDENKVSNNKTYFCNSFERKEILSLIPQKDPFRFIDNILELSDKHIVSEYHFKENEYFYSGHFPNNPVTPGVILLEAMAQTGLVALGIYLLRKETEKEEVKKDIGTVMTTLFTDCQADFTKTVKPGSKITISAEKIFWRKRKLRSQVEIILENKQIAASGSISGMGVIL